MSNCREPEDFDLLREDYPECLHHAKEVLLLIYHQECNQPSQTKRKVMLILSER
ncbi:hypothetical protein MKX03_006167 [Papaver bracteatum]|nr:hypothetical protein MKX03_006167 [Papaver bracteatum]